MIIYICFALAAIVVLTLCFISRNSRTCSFKSGRELFDFTDSVYSKKDLLKVLYKEFLIDWNMVYLPSLVDKNVTNEDYVLTFHIKLLDDHSRHISSDRKRKIKRSMDSYPNIMDEFITYLHKKGFDYKIDHIAKTEDVNYITLRFTYKTSHRFYN